MLCSLTYMDNVTFNGVNESGAPVLNAGQSDVLKICRGIFFTYPVLVFRNEIWSSCHH